jgi:hypothetical protein
MKKNVFRAAIEVGFIVFLFYTNLLMGEYMQGGKGQTLGFIPALRDIFSVPNFAIAVIGGFVGYGVVEFLRKML